MRIIRNIEGVLSFPVRREGTYDNDGTKINVELQRKAMKRWDKRQIFYLAKLFTSELWAGEDYDKLKRCISISILDFNLQETPEYHRIYRFRDKDGTDFSDMLEIHIIELQKQLTGNNSMDDWIRFFNAKTEEDLDMIKTKNQGIQTAVCEVKALSLPKRLRLRYEAHMKEIGTGGQSKLISGMRASVRVWTRV